MSMTLQRLQQYRALQREVRDLEYRLSCKHIVKDVVQGSSAGPSFALTVKTIEGYDKYSSRLQTKYYQAKLKAIEELNEISDYIDNIPDSITRQIFRFKFIDGWSYQRIAIYLNYVDEGTIRRRVRKHLKVIK